MNQVPVWLCPSMLADEWVSMELYTAELQESLARLDPPVVTEIHRPQVPPPLSRWQLNWMRYVGYPRFLRRELQFAPNKPLVHVTDHSYGHLARCHDAVVVTVHDLAGLTKEVGLQGPARMLYEWRVKQCRRAKALVAISHHTASDIEALLHVPKQNIHINYPAVAGGFHPSHGVEPKTIVAGELAQRKHATNSWLILHVGTNDKRKNVGVLCESIAKLRQKGIPAVLVKVGPELQPDEAFLRETGFSARDLLWNLGRLSLEELIEVYQVADVFSFPSLYEGFGRPVVEAQLSGLPVVCSSTSCLGEIAGKGALLHDPNNAEELSGHLANIFQNSPLREELVKCGLANAKRFSQVTHATQMAAIYQEVANACRL